MRMSAGAGKKRVLIIGGTRFSGLYLFKELHDRVRGEGSKAPSHTDHLTRRQCSHTA